MEPILDEFLHASLAEQIGRSPAIWWMPRLSPAVGNSDAKARRAVALCIFQFASRIWEAYQNPQILVLPQASANDANFGDNFRVSREGFVLQRDAKNYRFSLGDYGSENKGEHCFLMTLGVDMPRVGALPVDFSLPVNQYEPSFKLIEWMAMTLKLACARRRVSELSLPASADDCRMDTALEQWLGRKAGVSPGDPLGTLLGDMRKATESMAIGGLRRSQRSIGKLSEVAARGQELGTWIDSYLDGHRDVKEMLCGLMRAGRDVTHTCAPRSSPPREWVGPCEACRLDKHVDEFRLALGKRLDADDLEPVSGLDGVSTALRPGLLRAWRKFSKYPDDQVEESLHRGGPCGILRRPADRGIFPVNDYEVENIQDPNALLSGTELDFATILADDAKAYEEMERFEEDIPDVLRMLGKAKTVTEEADNRVADFFTECNVPPVVSDHPAFRAMLRAVKEGPAGYTPPGRRTISGSQLDRIIRETDKILDSRLRPAINTYGQTLVGDGWKSHKRRKMNVPSLKNVYQMMGIRFLGTHYMVVRSIVHPISPNIFPNIIGVPPITQYPISGLGGGWGGGGRPGGGGGQSLFVFA